MKSLIYSVIGILLIVLGFFYIPEMYVYFTDSHICAEECKISFRYFLFSFLFLSMVLTVYMAIRYAKGKMTYKVILLWAILWLIIFITLLWYGTGYGINPNYL